MSRSCDTGQHDDGAGMMDQKRYRMGDDRTGAIERERQNESDRMGTV